ncbi:unnamed protein product [Clonostachys chloroleuca]|uniref:Uncharacterized protein n=1 Tax=Clonostachys chloroleuca TaxID=1926264 RepID=A0AA35Q4N2_9HYPO|nr:unnamed protein product [Clonostachys chloroleuca]
MGKRQPTSQSMVIDAMGVFWREYDDVKAWRSDETDQRGRERTMKRKQNERSRRRGASLLKHEREQRITRGEEKKEGKTHEMEMEMARQNQDHVGIATHRPRRKSPLASNSANRSERARRQTAGKSSVQASGKGLASQALRQG